MPVRKRSSALRWRFLRPGFAATKLEESHAGAGVTKGTIYLSSKQRSVVQALIRQTIVPVIARAKSGEVLHGSARDLFEQARREYGVSSVKRSLVGIPKLMMAEANNSRLGSFYYDEVVTRGHRLMASVIERGVKAVNSVPSTSWCGQSWHVALMHAVLPAKAFSACMLKLQRHQIPDTHIDLYLHGISK